LLLAFLITLVGVALARLDPSRIASAFARARVFSLGFWRVPLGLALLLLAGNLLTLPFYGLVWRAGRVGGRATLGHPPTWSLQGLSGTLRSAAAEVSEPLFWSLIWTAVAATTVTILSLLLGWAARRSKIWSSVAMATLCLTLAAPGPVAGMALVLAYRQFPLVYDYPAMIVMAEAFRALPYAILLLWPFLRSFPQDYLDAAALDGLDRPRQFLRVVLPLSLRPILAAWAVAFAIGLGELAATNIATPPGVPPLSVVIWGLLHTGVESHLAGVALIVLIVIAGAGSFATIAIWSLRKIARPSAHVF
jgi:iron(III) transport system permease protein